MLFPWNVLICGTLFSEEIISSDTVLKFQSLSVKKVEYATVVCQKTWYTELNKIFGLKKKLLEKVFIFLFFPTWFQKNLPQLAGFKLHVVI